jgi:predicted transcriptional regulator
MLLSLLVDMGYKISKTTKNERSSTVFEPSMKTLSRILKYLLENDQTGRKKGKTKLSIDTHLNYSRLAKHVAWLGKKGFVQSTIEGSKIDVSLTRSGKAFASVILKNN